MGNKQTLYLPMNIFTNERNIIETILNKQVISETQPNIHEEFGWRIMLKRVEEMPKQLKDTFDNKENEWFRRNVIIVKTDSLFNEDIMPLLKESNSSLDFPFLILITSMNEKITDLFFSFKTNHDKYFITVLRDNAFSPCFLFEKLFQISSYYYQLGDKYNLPNDIMTEIKKSQQILIYNDQFNSSLNDKHLPEKIIRNRLNLLVLGRTGTGKSALINALLGRVACLEQHGTPVTNGIQKYKHDTYPLSFYDTIGFNKDSDFKGLFKEIQKMKKALNEQRDIIHMLIYTFNGQNARTFDENEKRYFIQIYNWLKTEFGSNKLPIIFVITYSSDIPNGNQKKRTIRGNISELINKNVSIPIIPVELYGGKENPPFGLDHLYNVLYEYFKEDKIPQQNIDDLKNYYQLNNKNDQNINSLSSIQSAKILSNNKIKEIESSIFRQSHLMNKLQTVDDIKHYCRYKALEVIGACAVLSLGCGAVNVVGQSIVTDTAVKIGMVISIGKIYNVVYTKKQALKLMSTFTGASVIANSVHVASSFLGLIPGMNIIDSGCCCISTIGLGILTIKTSCKTLLERNHWEFLINSMINFNEAIDSLEEMKNNVDPF